MITKLTRKIRRCSTVMILAAIVSCDSLKEDFIDPDKQVIVADAEYYILPGTSVIIDLKSIVKQSFASASLSISQIPTRGELTQLDTLLLKYKPGRDFVEGQDQFVYSVIGKGNVLKSATITIQMRRTKDELPCSLYAVQDKARVNSGSSVSIRFLRNDRMCGIDNSTIQVSIHSNTRFGESRLVGDSILVYTPGPDYEGKDELVYKLTSTYTGKISYGVITLSDKWKFQILKSPPGAHSTLFFVDENNGFVAGEGFFKTTDGGLHWNKVSNPPRDPYGYCNPQAVYFLDTINGFVGYSSCVSNISTGGLLITNDGGQSWKMVDLQKPVYYVFFTSLTTGFVSTETYTSDSVRIGSILKTEDGGATWKTTFTQPGGVFGIQFANSTTGYAHRLDKIYTTTDAGETWQSSIAPNSIFSLAVSPNNVICATVSYNASATAPSSIVRSTDGKSWNSVANFSYNSWRIAFSKSGNVAFTSGLSGPGPMLDDTLTHVLSISKSSDKGATWNEEELEEPLYGFPWAISIPSDEVAYFLCSDKLIKYTSQ